MELDLSTRKCHVCGHILKRSLSTGKEWCENEDCQLGPKRIAVTFNIASKDSHNQLNRTGLDLPGGSGLIG